jgi:two-component system, OmpR family, osmolarity sensor histidine kinase EnvZ
MKFLPVSLAARTVLLVIAIVAVAEISTFSLLTHFRRTSHANQTVQFIAGQVRLLQTVLPRLDADARRRIEATEVGEFGLQLRSDTANVPTHEPEFGFAHRLAADLDPLLDQAVTLRHAGRGRRSGL